MGLFVMTFSINKQIEMKAKDMTMLKAIIQTNNRIVQTKYNNTSKKFNIPVITNKINNKYSSYMWLLK
jgi:hypothetical protein